MEDDHSNTTYLSPNEVSEKMFFLPFFLSETFGIIGVQFSSTSSSTGLDSLFRTSASLFGASPSLGYDKIYMAQKNATNRIVKKIRMNTN